MEISEEELWAEIRKKSKIIGCEKRIHIKINNKETRAKIRRELTRKGYTIFSKPYDKFPWTIIVKKIKRPKWE